MAMSSKPTRPGFAFWATVLVVVVVLYVLSSGPARITAFSRVKSAPFIDHAKSHEIAPGIQKVDFVSYGYFSRPEIAPWWLAIYRPLKWASDQPWGAPLCWYWSLFPLREG